MCGGCFLVFTRLRVVGGKPVYACLALSSFAVGKAVARLPARKGVCGPAPPKTRLAVVLKPRSGDVIAGFLLGKSRTAAGGKGVGKSGLSR